MSGKADQQTGGRRPTKAERKDEARRQRIELQRQMAKARRRRSIWLVAVVVVALGAGIFLITRPEPPKPTLPGLLTGDAPWPANTDKLAARLDKLALPPQGAALHLHDQLQIFVHGLPAPVPKDVGIGPAASASLHTHDATGVIHAESATSTQFTLGQFFDVWGVRLTPTCIGGYCVSGQDRLQAWIDGKAYRGNLRALPLGQHQVIVVTFGTQKELPNPTPSSFDFAAYEQQ